MYKVSILKSYGESDTILQTENEINNFTSSGEWYLDSFTQDIEERSYNTIFITTLILKVLIKSNKE